jgi:hypothetical protein
MAAFVIGMAATFVAALLYSGSQQRLHSARAVNAFASQSALAARAQHVAPAQPGQEAVEKSTRDQQQETAATDGSTQQPPTAPDRLSKEETASQVGRISLPTVQTGNEIRPERIQRVVPQSSTSVALRPSEANPALIVDQQAAPAKQVQNEPQPAPVQPVQSAPQPKMPAAPQNGSVALAESTPLMLPHEDTNAVPPRIGPQVITVQPGTSIRVRLAEALSSDRNRAGDTFRAVIDSPVLVNGVVVAAAGANVFGRIAHARKAPLLGGRADLTLILTDITTADGHLARIATDGVQQVGARSGIVNTAKLATGTALGVVVGALDGAAAGAGISAPVKSGAATNGFFATNRTVVFPAGTQVVFGLAAPLKVTQQVTR